MGSLPTHTFVVADRRSWREPVQTVNGRPVTLLAIQRPRRTGPKRRKKRTFYLYRIRGREECVWRNTNPDVPVYKPTGYDSRTRRLYVGLFMPRTGVRTAEQIDWLKNHDYILVDGA